jgi:hypothetical protein
MPPALVCTNPLSDRKIAQRIVVVEQPTKEYGLVIWFYSE